MSASLPASELTRCPCTAYIGLGSNLDDPPRRLGQAVATLERYGVTLCRLSSLYRTEPAGLADRKGPWFFNRVAGVHTDRSPFELLRLCLTIEREQGRVRSSHTRHAPRTLDLDLLLYGGQRLETAELTLPHPGLARRRFVLVPMNEIAGWVEDPRTGLTMGELLERCLDESRVARVSVAEASTG